MDKVAMNYCAHCGGTVSLRVPHGELVARHVCDACHAVHYQNPKIVAGCIPEADDGRLLLCLRSIDPRMGYWTVPAGFMENGESVAGAALRETMEEACARVELIGLSSIISVTRANQVHMMYRARLLDGAFAAGIETTEARLFSEQEIPWQDIAFVSVRTALERFLADRRTGRFQLHEVSL